MNAVEIEQAISDLAERPFDPVEFPFAFLEAFGNKDTTLKKLRSATSNKSDLGGVLQATERLEKLFDMYTQMTTKVPQQTCPKDRGNVEIVIPIMSENNRQSDISLAVAPTHLT